MNIPISNGKKSIMIMQIMYYLIGLLLICKENQMHAQEFLKEHGQFLDTCFDWSGGQEGKHLNNY